MDRHRSLAIAALLAMGCSTNSGAGGQGATSSSSGSSSSSGASSSQTSDASSDPPFPHRPGEAAPCPTSRPPLRPGPPSGIDAGYACLTDADCTSGNEGRCNVFTTSPDAGLSGYCSYNECAVDSDCIDAGITPPCVCGDADAGGTNTCAANGTCSTDIQCPGGWCSPSYVPNCGGAASLDGYHCRTLQEACLLDSDCDGGLCAWDEPSGRWTCQTAYCCCG